MRLFHETCCDLSRQQRLYFLPLPQGQGSLRPIAATLFGYPFGLVVAQRPLHLTGHATLPHLSPRHVPLRSVAIADAPGAERAPRCRPR